MPFKNQHPLYHVWQGMRRRCLTPTSRAWKDYGGRGITICPEWDSFHQWLADMGPRPPGMSIDRIDNDKGYCPSNCRWADKKTQQRNQRRAVYVEIDGKQYRAIELADISGHSLETIKTRGASGLSYEEVMSPERRQDLSGLALGPLGKKAKAHMKTHCRRGHAFTISNTYVTKQGWRTCRICHNEKMRERPEANRAAHERWKAKKAALSA